MQKIFLISSPSGGGEDSVIEGLSRSLKFNRVITTVTRPMLKGEKQGKPYYFVTEKKFKGLLKKNAFVEWAKVYSAYRGCTHEEIKRLLRKKLPIIWKVDWQGVKSIQKLFPNSVSIFIAPPSYKVLEKRLMRRGRDSLKDIKKREPFTKVWLKHKNIYDHVILNKEGKLQETIEKVKKIIQAVSYKQ